MADENTIAIVLRAHDEASAAMAKAMDTLSRATGGLREGVAQAGKTATAFGGQLREAALAARLMGQGLLSEVNPALSQVVGSLSMATRAAAGMPIALGAATVAVVAAGTGLALFIARLKEAQEFQTQFNVAARGNNVGALRSLYEQNAQALERYNVLNKQFLDMWSSPSSFLTSIIAFWQKQAIDIDRTKENLKALREELGRTIPLLEIAPKSLAVNAQIAAGRGARAAFELGTGLQAGTATPAAVEALAGRMATATRQQAGFERTAIEVEIGEQIRLAKEQKLPESVVKGLENLLADRLRAIDEALASTLARIAETRRTGVLAARERGLERVNLAAGLGPGEIEAMLAFEAPVAPGEIPTIAKKINEDILASREKMLERINLAAGLGPGEIEAMLTAQAPGSTQDQEKRREEIRQADTESLKIARDRLVLQREQYGLTESERAALEAQVIEADRLLQIEEARGATSKENAANFEAMVRRQSLFQREMERTDFAAGLQRGLKDTMEEMENWGRTGQEVMRNFATTSQQYFKDLFVLPVERGWKQALEEAPRRFAMNLYNIFADVAARFATAQLFRGLGMPGVASMMTAGSLAFSPGAAGALSAGTQLTLSSGETVTVAQTASGGSAGFNMPTLPLGLLPQPGFLSNLMATPLFPASFGAGFTGGGVVSASLTSASEAAALEAAGMLNPAFTLGQGLSIAGGALGLGLTIFSALQGPPTFQNIAMSGVSGALSGMLLGSPGGPPGMIIGAIAGGLLGGGAGALGKGGKQKKPSASQRSLAAGQAGAQALSQAVAAATSLAELADVLNRQWAPHGEVQIGSNGFGWAGDWDDAASPEWLAAIARLKEPEIASTDPAFVETFMRGLWVQVGQTGAVPLHPELTAQVQEKGLALLDAAMRGLSAEAQGVFAFEEQVFGGVTRRTFLPTSPGGLLQGAGQQIMVSRSLLEQLISDPDTLERVLRKLVEIDRDRDLGFLTTEEFGFA